MTLRPEVKAKAAALSNVRLALQEARVIVLLEFGGIDEQLVVEVAKMILSEASHADG